jgi:predicted kinase
MKAGEQRPELIVFVGLQAAGKTTYYHEHFASSHVHVSKDLMRSVRNRDQLQRAQIAEALEGGRSVVVDNTNPTVFDRAPLIALAREHGARVIAYYFEAPVRMAVARNQQREGRARVPNVAIFATQKRLAPPTLSEGFDEVIVIAPPPAAGNEQPATRE